jgi:hypothetical protein
LSVALASDVIEYALNEVVALLVLEDNSLIVVKGNDADWQVLKDLFLLLFLPFTFLLLKEEFDFFMIDEIAVSFNYNRCYTDRYKGCKYSGLTCPKSPKSKIKAVKRK